MIKLIVYRIFHPILTAWAIKILSWEAPDQKPNPIRDKVTKKLALPQPTHEVLPPVQKPSVDYKQILDEHELAGKPIKPVKHRKPISKDTICPNCNAPYSFIYSNATIDSVKTKAKVQKLVINGFQMTGKSVLLGFVLTVDSVLISKSIVRTLTNSSASIHNANTS